jgi:hypothetical protein
MRVATGRPGGLALGASAVVALLVLGVTLALLVVGPPVPERWPERAPSPAASLLSPLPAAMPARAMLGHGDTIDGQTVVDGIFIERMKQVAARIPPAVLAGHSRDPRVRYLAQAFTPGDDPGLTEGWFEDPMAALAFGCAMEDAASLACSLAGDELALATMPSGAGAMDASSQGALSGDVAPGWRCRPLGVAIGSPAFEPERCESPG